MIRYLKIKLIVGGVDIAQAKKLRKMGLTYEELGKRYGKTSERMRQLLNPIKYLRCAKHRMRYITKCYKCQIDQEYANLTHEQIVLKIHKLKKHNRSKELVYERKKLINVLMKKFKHSPGFIGKLLDRDLTTIKHLSRTLLSEDKVQIKKKSYDIKRKSR